MATLAHNTRDQSYAFAFEREFLGTGHDPSPLHLSVARVGGQVQIFKPGSTPLHAGLPGLVADALPDAWGERLLKHEFPDLRTTMGKLAALGHRASGAISFEPILSSSASSNASSMRLSDLALEADAFRAEPVALDTNVVNQALARAGGTLGGAFPKLSAALPDAPAGTVLRLSELLVGDSIPSEHRPVVLKLERFGDECEGTVEFAFWQMARKAGLRVPQAWLVEDGGRRHFATARFDREPDGKGGWRHLHVHSLSGFLHRRAAGGDIGYEELIRSARALGGVEEAQEAFSRIVFNLLATNRDDHGRNHAFLYDDRERSWKLSPAYDLNPNVCNTLIALNWLGSMELPRRFDDVLRLGRVAGLDTKAVSEIFAKIEASTVDAWDTVARDCSVSDFARKIWGHEMQTQTASLRADFRKATAPRRRKGS
jgi:serine/threonine-protein kinase HipA